MTVDTVYDMIWIIRYTAYCIAYYIQITTLLILVVMSAASELLSPSLTMPGCIISLKTLLLFTPFYMPSSSQATELLMGQEIEVVFMDIEPYKSIKASETKARDLRVSLLPGQIVWGVVKKVSVMM